MFEDISMNLRPSDSLSCCAMMMGCTYALICRFQPFLDLVHVCPTAAGNETEIHKQPSSNMLERYTLGYRKAHGNALSTTKYS